MITIGPWWLFDSIIVIFAFFILYAGIKSGFYVALYFLGFAIVGYLLLTFIPQLLTNVTMPSIYGWLNHQGVFKNISANLDSLQNALGSAMSTLLKDFGQSFGNLSLAGFGDDVLQSIIAIAVYLVFFLIIAITLLVIMFVIYAVIKQRLKAAKINKYVSSFVGGVFGAIIALLFASTSAILFTFPIFDYSSQRLGVNNSIGTTKDKNSNYDIKYVMEHGNQFSNYAITGKLANLIPAGAATLSYSASCTFKYAIAPLVNVLGNKDILNGNEDNKTKMEELFSGFSGSVIRGYATDNIFELPVKQCIQVLPAESQNVIRMISEFIMDSGIIKTFGSNSQDDLTNPDRGQAQVLFRQMSDYQRTFFGSTEIKMKKSDFLDFWNWSATQKGGNQFLKSVAYLQKNNPDDMKDFLSVMSDPNSAYRFMKNVYEVNMRYATSSAMPFLPSVLSALYFMPGLELVPSGSLSAIMGQSVDETGQNKIDYNFELKNHMAYING